MTLLIGFFPEPFVQFAETAAEQLLYEIGDPAADLLPDVVCDWTEVRLEDTESGVLVSGSRGKPPPPTLKGCAQIPDGWRAISLLFVGGRDAVAKAERVGRDLITRGETMLADAGFDRCEVATDAPAHPGLITVTAIRQDA